ncbi:hypothetical protein ACROYT_G038348 [Oculina patagonica]
MRQANRAILREKHPVCTIEETLQEAKVFFKLNLNMAFHQVELASESRDITTFAEPNGIYRYKRLIFSVNMTTKTFQQIIWQILKDCPGTHNIHDDICVVGASEEEHEERLNQVMKKLVESGLTLNYDKCQIVLGSMEYLGSGDPCHHRGIGAVLEQKQEDGLYIPVHYASRKLTPPESRYSQFEREFSIRHIPGRENAADALSRLSVDSVPDAAIKQTEEYARTIVADAIPAAFAPRQVESESERDLTPERCHSIW